MNPINADILFGDFADDPRRESPRWTGLLGDEYNDLPMTYKSIDQLPLVLNVNQLAEVLGIGLNRAYALVRSGSIRNIRIGRQYKIPKDALSAFLAA